MTKTSAKQPIPDSGANTSGTTLGSTPVDETQVVEILLLLRARPLASGTPSLAQFVADLAAKAPRDRTHLTHEELAQKYGASQADADAVEAFAEDNGLTVAKPVHLGSRTMRLSGSVADIARAFDIAFVNRVDGQGNEFRSYDGPVSVPTELGSVLTGVAGLDDRPLARRGTRPPPQGKAEPSTELGGYLPTEVAEMYAYPPEHDGTGQCIGILELAGGYESSDLVTYFTKVVKLDPPPPPVIDVPADGNVLAELLTENYEVTQDIEIASAMAPGAQIVVYFGTGGNNELKIMLEVLDSALFDETNRPSVLSLSWQLPESSLQNAMSQRLLGELEQRFLAAAALGITLCACTGDSGALTYYTDYTLAQEYNNAFGAPPEVNFPATSQYVLACGGTSLHGTDGARTEEVVWNCYAEAMTLIATGPDGSPVSLQTNGGASTGGVSVLFDPPPYQSESNVPTLKTAVWNKGLATDRKEVEGRGVPDVASNADFNTGYAVLFQGLPATGGGTSAAAPAWAALIARLNQALGHRIGFINPSLYRLQTVEHADVLYPIVHGNNGGYEASPSRRWNACTGLGSPDGAKLLAALGK